MAQSTYLTGAAELFREEQRFIRTWVVIPVGVVAVMAWYVFLHGMWNAPEAANDAPAAVFWLVFILVGIGVPLLFAFMRLTVTVTRLDIQIRYRPIYSRTLSLRDVSQVEAVTYRPILEFGGWGIRYSRRRRCWGYTVSGTAGVQIELKNGKRVLVGSAQSNELARVIKQALQM